VLAMVRPLRFTLASPRSTGLTRKLGQGLPVGFDSIKICPCRG